MKYRYLLRGVGRSRALLLLPLAAAAHFPATLVGTRLFAAAALFLAMLVGICICATLRGISKGCSRGAPLLDDTVSRRRYVVFSRRTSWPRCVVCDIAYCRAFLVFTVFSVAPQAGTLRRPGPRNFLLNRNRLQLPLGYCKWGVWFCPRSGEHFQEVMRVLVQLCLG